MKMRYFRIAKQLSEKSDHPKHKLGAVIVKKNRILGIGFNRNKTHTKAPHAYKHIHAECDAVFSAKDTDLKNACIYIYRELKDGNLGLAKCCPSCMKMLKEKGIKKIYFTTYTGFFEEYL